MLCTRSRYQTSTRYLDCILLCIFDSKTDFCLPLSFFSVSVSCLLHLLMGFPLHRGVFVMHLGRVWNQQTPYKCLISWAHDRWFPFCHLIDFCEAFFSRGRDKSMYCWQHQFSWLCVLGKQEAEGNAACIWCLYLLMRNDVMFAKSLLINCKNGNKNVQTMIKFF